MCEFNSLSQVYCQVNSCAPSGERWGYINTPSCCKEYLLLPIVCFISEWRLDYFNYVFEIPRIIRVHSVYS